MPLCITVPCILTSGHFTYANVYVEGHNYVLLGNKVTYYFRISFHRGNVAQPNSVTHFELDHGCSHSTDEQTLLKSILSLIVEYWISSAFGAIDALVGFLKQGTFPSSLIYRYCRKIYIFVANTSWTVRQVDVYSSIDVYTLLNLKPIKYKNAEMIHYCLLTRQFKK